MGTPRNGPRAGRVDFGQSLFEALRDDRVECQVVLPIGGNGPQLADRAQHYAVRLG